MTEFSFATQLRLDEARRGLALNLTATDAQRAAIAQAFDLAGIHRLTAQVATQAEGAGARVRITVDADVVYVCGVSLNPFPAQIDGQLDLLFLEGTPPEENLDEIDVDPFGEDPPEYVAQGRIEIGDYAKEALALSLDPFPRAPGAEFAPPEPEEPPSPFAKLAKLRQTD